VLVFSIKLTTISVTWLKAKFRFQRIHQTHLIISSGTHITINKACLHLVSCNSPTLSAPQRTSIMEEIRITSVYFRMSRLLRASAISSRVSYFISRGVTSVQGGTISSVFCEEAFFTVYLHLAFIVHPSRGRIPVSLVPPCA